MARRRLVRFCLSASLLTAGCGSLPVPPTPFYSAPPVAQATASPAETLLPSDVLAPADALPESARWAVMMPVAEELMGRLNDERAAIGLPPLTPSDALVEIAFARAEDMTARSYLAHQDPLTGRTLPLDLMAEAGFGGSLAETLFATSVPMDDVAATTLAAWLTSPSHRDTILSPGYRFVGSGIMGDSNAWRVVLLLAENEPIPR